jgi:glycine/D-amino acid oxidase-like deaminating enzyme
VLDGADIDHRASVDNFGLIWVQGKGYNFPAYANWSLQGANLWLQFADQLSHTIDFEYTVLDRDAALALQPRLGEAVAGAIYSPQDGQVNPLYLLSALHKSNQLHGVEY